MPFYLGISSIDCDVTVTFLKDEKIVYASQEERFTRQKQQDGFPYHAIEDGLKFLDIGINDLNAIGFGWLKPEEERRLYLKTGWQSIRESFRSPAPLFQSVRHALNVIRRGLFINYREWKKSHNTFLDGLNQIGYQGKVTYFHHQLCHIASAYYTSGFDKSLVVSLDGYGSGCAGSIYLGAGENLELQAYIPSPQSLGMMYGRVTKALGFIPNRHEGKVLGLAAYGNPDVYFDEIMKDFILTEDGFIYLNTLDPFKNKKIFGEGKKEDLAAAFQKVLETVVVHTVQIYLKKYNLNRVCLAGGVAANVKMNQRVMEIEGVEEVFVHPGMSDCGIGTGAALLLAHKNKPFQPYRLDNVFFGPEFTEAEILEAIQKFDFAYTKEENPEKRAAELLAQGYVVGRFNGRMEYGPRALCNRTIMAPTQQDDVNKWLNKRLNRTEFMPFAPATLDYMADSMYLNVDKIRYTAEFMTITTDCTDEMKKNSPAAVHVDGTARPQIVTPKSNPSMFKILEYYYRLTGVPNLVNTSFNMHEEPIICTPYDAVKTFNDGRLDYLSIGNYMLESPHIEKH
ncbi:MAG: carbamoyltransferase [Saprospiraceae bacterium]